MTPNDDILKGMNSEIEKHNHAIRDLIVVGRTCLESIKELREVQREDHKQNLEWHKQFQAELDKLRAAQASTDEKLNILIDTVDRIIRRMDKNGG